MRVYMKLLPLTLLFLLPACGRTNTVKVITEEVPSESQKPDDKSIGDLIPATEEKRTETPVDTTPTPAPLKKYVYADGQKLGEFVDYSVFSYTALVFKGPENHFITIRQDGLLWMMPIMFTEPDCKGESFAFPWDVSDDTNKMPGWRPNENPGPHPVTTAFNQLTQQVYAVDISKNLGRKSYQSRVSKNLIGCENIASGTSITFNYDPRPLFFGYNLNFTSAKIVEE